MRFTESSQNSIIEKSIFGHSEVIFLNIQFSPPGGSGFFPLVQSRKIFFKEKMSSLAGLRKS